MVVLGGGAVSDERGTPAGGEVASSHSLTLAHTHSRTHSLSHTLTLAHTHSLTLSLSHTLTLAHTHSHALTLALSHPLTHSPCARQVANVTEYHFPKKTVPQKKIFAPRSAPLLLDSRYRS